MFNILLLSLACVQCLLLLFPFPIPNFLLCRKGLSFEVENYILLAVVFSVLVS